ncbi:MAG TPA: SIMPL domain-containing protein [Levilinea sp.]|nr:SIMPL domain-containing protein [Levilinea sp.]
MKAKLPMLITGLLAVFVLAACAAPVSIPVAGAAIDQRRTIIAQGTGEVILTPDIAYISVGIESRASEVSEALSMNNDLAASIAGVLRDLGIEDRDIQTSAFNVYPMQQFGPAGEMLEIVYVVNNTVNITVRNLQTLGELLDASVRAGANTINSIQFDVDDNEAAIKEARRLAIEDARQTATELAEAAGVELGDLVTLNVYPSGLPVMMDRQAVGGLAVEAAMVPIAAGQLVLIYNADLTYEIK